MIGASVRNAPIWLRAGVVTIGVLRVVALIHGQFPWPLNWFYNFSGARVSLSHVD